MFDERFEEYLKKERSMASTSLRAYISDVKEFCGFLAERGKMAETAGNADVAAFLLQLKDAGKSGATVNRKLASVRAYYDFLSGEDRIDHDPTNNIKSPRIARREIEYLSIEEVDRLLESPDESVKGIRDRALLELMYATGMRSSEVSLANLSDLNLQIGFISCTQENGKTRIIPIGRPARAAMERYINEVRGSLIGEGSSEALFVNYMGQRISRQGIWKILKYYGEKAGVGAALNPQILRNSFAAHMIQNGADLKSLQEILGHEDITATKMFLSLSKNRIMDVYDKAFPRA